MNSTNYYFLQSADNLINHMIYENDECDDSNTDPDQMVSNNQVDMFGSIVTTEVMNDALAALSKELSKKIEHTQTGIDKSN